MGEKIYTQGECKCGVKINRIENDPAAITRDMVRYDYADGMTTNRSIFRCRGCGEVIFDNWREIKSVAKGGRDAT